MSASSNRAATHELDLCPHACNQSSEQLRLRLSTSRHREGGILQAGTRHSGVASYAAGRTTFRLGNDASAGCIAAKRSASGAAAGIVALLAVATICVALIYLIVDCDDRWIFYAVVIVPPLALIAIQRPEQLYLRYFMISIAASLLLLAAGYPALSRPGESTSASAAWPLALRVGR